jgi:hypothetical protein
MANPPRKKGTGGETELLQLLQDATYGFAFRNLVRTPASSRVDLAAPGEAGPINALATRPDRGQWLVTVDLDTFKQLVYWSEPAHREYAINIEVKRYSRFSLHTIFESKFGRKK